VVRWSLAPAVMRYEALGLRAALRRSAQIVRAQRSGMSNVSLALTLIGWLIVSVPVIAVALLAELALPAFAITGRVAALIWAVGSVFVAPLLALGAAEFYVYVRDRTPGALEQLETEHSRLLEIPLPQRGDVKSKT
jgi:hypothetical protein